MQLREELSDKYSKVALEIDYDMPNKVGGYYTRDEIDPDGLITITGKANHYIQNEIIAEELGHHETSYGNILGAYTKSTCKHVEDLKQELKARRLGFKLAVPLEKLIKCYKQGIWGDLYEMCLTMQIDRSYFHAAIEDYKKQFGNYVNYEGYHIQFEPLEIKQID
ncbi:MULTISPECIES: hypothetical protein [Staphylococcus]|uniref:hypothetical protein n=1 Tax=Staphylococcus TaxID=1279 RepID=UPI00094BC13F|nr:MULTISPECIES: hypothetical protein [Staphylococcus]MDW4259485.1 hypothetical protein [Staphylococcus saprophyticus]MDW4324077.1 hypothetical protein [Staphylococcus saprophyticus]MDW4399903.1 hypothetical protein [Staphylococcus saprophyticus]MDW4454276.1 hypothetical protein [Staphylococcus saprophyticus]MDW4489970.1 hypothetical protein [Staphylococcus saprophyticus]